MFVDWSWPDSACDLCDGPDATITAVAKGNTGRWCPVLAMCEDCAPDTGYEGETLLSIDEARTVIDLIPGEYADF